MFGHGDKVTHQPAVLSWHRDVLMVAVIPQDIPDQVDQVGERREEDEHQDEHGWRGEG